MAYTVTWIEIPDEDADEGPNDIQIITVRQFDVNKPTIAVDEMMKNVDGSEFSSYTTRFIVVEDIQICSPGQTLKNSKLYKPVPPKPTWTFEEVKS